MNQEKAQAKKSPWRIAKGDFPRTFISKKRYRRVNPFTRSFADKLK
jgi:hypothetical protein